MDVLNSYLLVSKENSVGNTEECLLVFILDKDKTED